MLEVSDVSSQTSSPQRYTIDHVGSSDSDSRRSKHRRNSEMVDMMSLDESVFDSIARAEQAAEKDAMEEAREAYNVTGKRFLETAKIQQAKAAARGEFPVVDHTTIEPSKSTISNDNNDPVFVYTRPLGMPMGRRLCAIPSSDGFDDSDEGTRSMYSSDDVGTDGYDADEQSNLEDSVASSDFGDSQPPSDGESNRLESRLTNALLHKAFRRDGSSRQALPRSDDAQTRSKSHHSKPSSRKSRHSKHDPMRKQASSKIGSDEKMCELERAYLEKYYKELEHEKSMLMDAWREEFGTANNSERRRSSVIFAKQNAAFSNCCSDLCSRIFDWLSYAECFISNLPLTIGAVGLSWVTQGVIWFKFMEENNDSCTTVRFNSPQCTYPEFPGCFECDTTNPIYRGVVIFHYFCHCVAALCCVLFFLKCCIASRVVIDELSNPTTSTPAGVVCITIICVAAGRGAIGEVIVLITSVFHIGLSIWFLYMALYQYRLWPDPGWFPNTVGIAYAAIKTWLYFPMPGLVFMTICVVYLFSTFGIAIYRAMRNTKIAAPVCFISLSAPSITMYAMTIMAQPTYKEEQVLLEDAKAELSFEQIHRSLYLPVMHFMMIMCLVGFAASLQCLWTRWPQFKLKEFSPAHVAFIFPLLSHTNAVQAYRSGFISFSESPEGSPFKIILFTYWFTCLIIGTVLNFIFTYKYVVRLPRWTKVDSHKITSSAGSAIASNAGVADLEMNSDASRSYRKQQATAQGRVTPVMVPVACPSDSSHFSLSDMDEISVVQSWMDNTDFHEVMHQPFTNPSVLHANEKGALMRVRRGTAEFERHGPYVRTRQVQSLGFDLTLTNEEFERESRQLLEWVATNAPRRRNRTMSIPIIMELRGPDGRDMYGTFGNPGLLQPSAFAAAHHAGRSAGGQDTNERSDGLHGSNSDSSTSDSSGSSGNGGRPHRHHRSNTWSGQPPRS